MSLTNEDAQAISQLLDDKLKPINQRLGMLEQGINCILQLQNLDSRIRDLEKEISEVKKRLD